MTGLGLLGLCAVIAAFGYLLMTMATRNLLEAEARIDASRWSAYLKANLKDLPEITEGAALGSTPRMTIDPTMTGGHVISFKVYDARGFLKLQSNEGTSANLIGRHITQVLGVLERDDARKRDIKAHVQGSTGDLHGFGEAVEHPPSGTETRTEALFPQYAQTVV